MNCGYELSRPELLEISVVLHCLRHVRLSLRQQTPQAFTLTLKLRGAKPFWVQVTPRREKSRQKNTICDSFVTQIRRRRQTMLL